MPFSLSISQVCSQGAFVFPSLWTVFSLEASPRKGIVARLGAKEPQSLPAETVGPIRKRPPTTCPRHPSGGNLGFREMGLISQGIGPSFLKENGSENANQQDQSLCLAQNSQKPSAFLFVPLLLRVSRSQHKLQREKPAVLRVYLKQPDTPFHKRDDAHASIT